ncbi:hypothetical protein EMIHUDRAFT_462781 [Emiliania huxleyi CCMP1516]|uniref:DNA mismatch repair proteins mutS family domain-containing protein n=2 Tax=Emiliania huxleyi TaxID=2903 RepID=A0A0D3K584_EMIH1|nr:hypothetical protein EMIHUDRAFT_462781 [Emiliania huxleyi CCMP1516]EOD30919.1 hypothetical protein EMIHUDRAFT_462781 [Emiliania huxleyi CCMP1516]|eukprot:XP_005783348.1 hypothetical protein EMIHUDRAFT_462781 [Emiliania huxleyi CCMP1516]
MRRNRAPQKDSDEPADVDDDPLNASIIAIVENAKFEVGVAVICLADYAVEISQFCDDPAYSKTVSMIARHEPRQLFFTAAMKDSVLECIVKNEFSFVRIEHRSRKHWDELRGLGHLHYFWEHEATVFVKGMLRIKFTGAHGVLLLDPASESLYGILKAGCKTSSGARLLRSSLIQPSNDLSTINTRQECVLELLGREDTLLDLQRILPQLADCDRVLKHFMQRSSDASKQSQSSRAEASIASVLHLKQLVQIAPTLAYDAKYEKRHAQRQLQCLFAARNELSGSLKTHRETLGALTLQMEELLESLQRDLSLESLKLNYSQRRGYHFTLPAAERPLAVQHNFIHIQIMSKRTVGCSTEKLQQINSRCRELLEPRQPRIAGEHSAVPNDVFVTPACNLQLITGPNMAGKSTYLRQVALICLMAHIGCPVPAEDAQVPLLQRVFTRISTSDSLETNASSFVSEMRETSYILRNTACTTAQYCTDFLAEVAGIPAGVCAAAKRLAERVEFDPVDANAERSRAEANRNSIAERLVMLQRSSTLSDDDLSRFMHDLQGRATDDANDSADDLDEPCLPDALRGLLGGGGAEEAAPAPPPPPPPPPVEERSQPSPAAAEAVEDPARGEAVEAADDLGEPSLPDAVRGILGGHVSRAEEAAPETPVPPLSGPAAGEAVEAVETAAAQPPPSTIADRPGLAPATVTSRFFAQSGSSTPSVARALLALASSQPGTS